MATHTDSDKHKKYSIDNGDDYLQQTNNYNNYFNTLSTLVK